MNTLLKIYAILLTIFAHHPLVCMDTNRACGQPGMMAQTLQQLINIQSLLDQPATPLSTPSCSDSNGQASGSLAQIFTILSSIQTNFQLQEGECTCDRLLTLVIDFADQLPLVTPGIVYAAFVSVLSTALVYVGQCQTSAAPENSSACSYASLLQSVIDSTLIFNPAINTIWSTTDEAIAINFRQALDSFFFNPNCQCAS